MRWVTSISHLNSITFFSWEKLLKNITSDIAFLLESNAIEHWKWVLLVEKYNFFCSCTAPWQNHVTTILQYNRYTMDTCKLEKDGKSITFYILSPFDKHGVRLEKRSIRMNKLCHRHRHIWHIFHMIVTRGHFIISALNQFTVDT